LTSMHDSPYTSVNWRWISIGLTPFAFKNRITAQTSHLAGAASITFATNGCRAKTEHGSDWWSVRLSVLAGWATACLGVGEPTNKAEWPTVTRTVSLQPQHYGDLTFGITHVHHCIVLSTCSSLKHVSSVRHCVQSWQQYLLFLRCSPEDDHFRLEPLQQNDVQTDVNLDGIICW